MSYPKIIEENLYALKEKKFVSHVPKMNFQSENRKWKKKDIIFHKNKTPKRNFAFVTSSKQSGGCSYEVQNHMYKVNK